MLLEDPDGAPYPEAVQTLWAQMLLVISPDNWDEYQTYLVEALETVANYSYE